jgi:hypothetical protein
LINNEEREIYSLQTTEDTKMDTFNYKVYMLVDPQDSTTGYLGRTKMSMQKRYNYHKYCANHRTWVVSKWLKGLYDAGLKPEVKVLFQLDCTEAKADEIESTMIRSLLATGFNLKNQTLGGAGHRTIGV